MVRAVATLVVAVLAVFGLAASPAMAIPTQALSADGGSIDLVVIGRQPIGQNSDTTLRLVPGAVLLDTNLTFYDNVSGLPFGTVTITPISPNVWNVDTSGLPAGQFSTDSLRVALDGTTPTTFRWPISVSASGPTAPVLDVPAADQTLYRTFDAAAAQVNGERGTQVAYTAPDGYTLTGATVSAQVFPNYRAGTADGLAWTVSPDGQQITITIPRTHSSGQPVVGNQPIEFGISVQTDVGVVDTFRVVVQSTPPTPAPAVIGVVGTNTVYYARDVGGPYRNLAGSLVSDPVVVRTAAETNLYIAQSPNGLLYVRSDTVGWARLNDPPSYCYDPDAEAIGGDLVLACRGGNNKLYLARVPIPGLGLPYIPATAFSGRGGMITVGPGLSVDGNGVVSMLVVGGNYPGGNLYETRTDLPAGSFVRRNLTCSAAPAVVNRSGTEFVACRSATGSLLVTQGGSTKDYAGQIIGRPGLNPAVDGTGVLVSVTGTNTGIYQLYDGPTRSGSYVRLPGAASTGVGAAGTVPANATPGV